MSNAKDGVEVSHGGPEDANTAVTLFEESDSLANPDAKTLELMLREVEALGTLRSSRPDDPLILHRGTQIRSAFKTASSNAAPLSPALRSNFLSGQNPGDAGWALFYIGPQAWPALTEGLTNDKPTVRISSADLVGYLPRDLALLSLPNLLSLSREGDLAERCIAVASIERIKPPAKVVVPLLSDMLAGDPAYQARSAAAKALSVFSPESEVARKALEEASRSDPDSFVRKVASEGLKDAVD
jgi:hypothetical protein